jgi:hypothetical protein
MRAATCVLLLLCPVVGRADDAAYAVTGRWGDRPVSFAGSAGTYYEGLIVALLGSCTAETPSVATKERWENALKGFHLRIQFAKPRKFAVVGAPEGKELEVDEILAPFPEGRWPPWMFVRSGDSYRAFTKYRPKICSFIQEELKSLADR